MKKSTQKNNQRDKFSTPLDVLNQAKILGKWLKIARKKRGLTQASVAMRIGVARDVIIKAEQGLPVSSHSLLAMAWMVGLLNQWVDAVSDSKDDVGIAISRNQLSLRIRAKERKDEF